MKPIIDQNTFFWEIIKTYLAPLLLVVVAIIVFSYLTSVGKKKLGIYIGVALVVAAVAWLIINFTG